MESQTAATDAIARTRALLKPEFRDNPVCPGGYLQAMHNHVVVEGLAPRLMHSSAITAIYERWWRPGLGWLLKGPNGPSMADEYDLAAELMQIKPGHRVLDLACGPGNFSRRFSRQVGASGLVVGFDGSRNMLDAGVTRASNANCQALAFVLGNATELPFDDASFNSVCIFAALHMFDKPFQALEEVERVLTPAGRLAMLTSCRSDNPVLGPIHEVSGKISGQRMFRATELRDALADRGFNEITQQFAGPTQIVGATKAA